MRGNQIRGQLTRSYLLVIVVTVTIILLLFQLIPFTPGDRLAARLALTYGQQLAPLIQDHLNDNPNHEETRKLLQAAVSRPEPSLNERQALILQRTILAALQIERVMLLSADGEVLAEGIVADVDPAGLPADWEDRAIQLETGDGASNFLLVQTGLDLSQAGALQPALWRFTGGTGLFAALIGAGLSWFLVQQITTPLTQLRNAAVKMTEEGKAEPLEVEGENELADLARAFNRMTTTIEQQQTQRRQFVADIAHELRTPLTIMQVNLEGLQDGMQSVDSAGRVISQEIQALTRLIDDLRLLSLADVEALTLNQTLLEVKPWLLELLSGWQVKAAQKEIDLRILGLEKPTDSWKIWGDPERLQQVLSNLMENALQHTPSDGTIEIEVDQRGDQELVISVTDTGPGIPAEMIDRVFERFFRLDRSRSRQTGGSGLGLAIVQRLVTAHGGRVTAANQPAGGARFTVALPLR